MRTSPMDMQRKSTSVSPLRQDLRSILVRGSTRVDRIIVDEISGRFARVSDHVWQRLQGGDADGVLLTEARAAGWTRDRVHHGRFSFNPFAIRVTLGSIDRIAIRISRWSGMVFSLPAVFLWTVFVAVMFVLVAFRADEVLASFTSLDAFISQSGPLLIPTVFVLTKVVHELAHAVVCRRIGSRVGSFGILFLCGMPCPYCDVTDIWRQPSAAKRVAVMLAGIYVELIMAALASVVWLCALDPATKLFALNVMIVCGISTIVFNANPLMRYDGYYALADLVGSTHLRSEARSMFSSVVTSRFAGSGFGFGRRSDRRACGLTFYHVAAVIYRVVVWIAIASFMVYIAEMFRIRSVAIATVALLLMTMIAQAGKKAISIFRGKGHWEHVPRARRGFVLTIIGTLVLAVLFTPLPRFRRVSGSVDAAFASTVFFSSGGIVEEVFAEYGDRVEQGQSLVHLSSGTLMVEQARLSGQWKVAKLRSSLSRRSNLDESRYSSSYEQPSGNYETPSATYGSASLWPALQAAEEAVSARLASSRKRVLETKVKSRASGIVIPIAGSDFEASGGKPIANSLKGLEGRAVETQTPWCRVSPDGSMHAVLVIDARDRQMIDVGSPVNVYFTKTRDDIIRTSVVSVSEIRPENSNVLQQAVFRVICPLPAQKGNQFLSLLGAECHGVFPLAKRSLVDYIQASLGDWIRG